MRTWRSVWWRLSTTEGTGCPSWTDFPTPWLSWPSISLPRRDRPRYKFNSLLGASFWGLSSTHFFIDFSCVQPTGLGKLDLDRAFDISKYLCVTPTSLVLSLIYLERLRSQNPVYLATVSSTDLFLVSLVSSWIQFGQGFLVNVSINTSSFQMLSSKFLHDDGEEDEVFNESWAEAGYTDIKELNDLEIDFLW